MRSHYTSNTYPAISLYSQKEPPPDMITAVDVPDVGCIQFHNIVAACNVGDGDKASSGFKLDDIPVHFQLDDIQTNFVMVGGCGCVFCCVYCCSLKLGGVGAVVAQW